MKKKLVGRIHYKKGSVFVKRTQFAAVVAKEIERKLRRYPRVCIDRFGCFEKRKIAGRTFTHKNGMKIRQKGRIKIHFVPSLPFKKAINK